MGEKGATAGGAASGVVVQTDKPPSGPPGAHRKRSTSIMVLSGMAGLLGDKTRKAGLGFRRAKTSAVHDEATRVPKSVEESKVAMMVKQEMDSLKVVTNRADEKMHSLLTAFVMRS